MPNCTNRRDFLLTVVLLLAGMAALGGDVPVASLVRGWNQSPTIAAYLGYLSIFEPYGHGLGVILVLFAMHQLDPSRRWGIPRIVACTIAAGGLADLLKMLILRNRPYEADLSGSVWNTFGSLLPLITGGSEGQSFPSAHTATAVGLSAGLIWLYPQGRVLFVFLAAMVGCQRIASMAHFPSDVLFGAAAGCFITRFILERGILARCFDKWEADWRSNAIPPHPDAPSA